MNTDKMPLESDFAFSLALHTVLAAACKVLDNPDANPMDKVVAETTILTILEALDEPEN